MVFILILSSNWLVGQEQRAVDHAVLHAYCDTSNYYIGDLMIYLEAKQQIHSSLIPFRVDVNFNANRYFGTEYPYIFPFLRLIQERSLTLCRI